MNVSGRTVTRNTLLNLVGQVIPLLVALPVIPYLVHSLGKERFGVYSLVFVVVGCLTVLDLGLGRATTKFVAEAMAKGWEGQVRPILWSSLTVVLLLSTAGAIILSLLTPLLVGRVLNIPPDLADEAKKALYVASVSIVVSLLRANLNGVLEAQRRFGLLNALKVPANVATFFLAAAAVYLGASLPVVFLLIVIKNLAVAWLTLLCILRTTPAAQTFPVHLRLIKPMLAYGGWTTLHNLSLMGFTYLDRLLVGVFLTLSAVTFYSVAYELASRLLILPSSLMVVLFPAFSSLGVVRDETLIYFSTKMLRYLALSMGLMVGALFVFAREIVLLWLGPGFLDSVVVLQVFSVGVFLNALAWLIGTLLQGTNGVRIVAVIHLVQLPLYVATTWLFIRLWGINGAAVSWAARPALTLLLMVILGSAAQRFLRGFLLRPEFVKPLLLLLVTCAVAAVVKMFVPLSGVGISVFLTAFLASIVAVLWFFALKPEEKALALLAMRKWSPLKIDG